MSDGMPGDDFEKSTAVAAPVERIVIQLDYDVDSAGKCIDMLILEDFEDGGAPVLTAGYKGRDGKWRYYPLHNDDPDHERSFVVGNVIAWAAKPLIVV